MNTTMDRQQINVKFLAIDQYVTSNIIEPKEIVTKTNKFVGWGEQNNYPYYINDLYDNVSTLKSIINGTSDYIKGEGVENDVKINSKGELLSDLIESISLDLLKYGGYAINVIRDRNNKVKELHYLDFKKVRSNREGSKLYYSTEWDSRSFGRAKYIEYDSFNSEIGKTKASTIFYYKNDINRVYPTPMWSAAVIAAETERKLNEYHLNNVSNSFASNYIINFNNGRPSDEIQEEIEEQVYDKFCGAQNAGRPMLSFNESKEAETTVTKIETDDFVDKYNALSERTQQELFTAFRATPKLFGLPEKNIGFNTQEYEAAFKLFNKTVVQPLQKVINRGINKIYDSEVCKIIPFEITFNKED